MTLVFWMLTNTAHEQDTPSRWMEPCIIFIFSANGTKLTRIRHSNSSITLPLILFAVHMEKVSSNIGNTFLHVPSRTYTLATPQFILRQIYAKRELVWLNCLQLKSLWHSLLPMYCQYLVTHYNTCNTPQYTCYTFGNRIRSIVKVSSMCIDVMWLWMVNTYLCCV